MATPGTQGARQQRGRCQETPGNVQWTPRRGWQEGRSEGRVPVGDCCRHYTGERLGMAVGNAGV